MQAEDVPDALFQQVNERWIIPEIKRRQSIGKLSGQIAIRRCLITLPPDAPPVVAFNDEVVWEANVRLPSPRSFEVNEVVSIHEIECVEDVELPTRNGIRVPFYYVAWNGRNWVIIFDLVPYVDSVENETEKPGASLRKAIAETLNFEMTEKVLALYDAQQTSLNKIGLWPAPALMIYPLSAILKSCFENSFSEAESILVEFCKDDFLEGMVNKWADEPAFNSRSRVFEQALHNLKIGYYEIAIMALVPNVEGVVVDWLCSNIDSNSVYFRQESRMKQFRDIVNAKLEQGSLESRVMAATLKYVLEGPFLATFTTWNQPIASEFPNRHVVGHGKSDVAMYSRVNAIKMFLLLDTLHEIMAKYFSVE